MANLLVRILWWILVLPPYYLQVFGLFAGQDVPRNPKGRYVWRYAYYHAGNPVIVDTDWQSHYALIKVFRKLLLSPYLYDLLHLNADFRRRHDYKRMLEVLSPATRNAAGPVSLNPNADPDKTYQD
eukprot:jgi/Botrbrau1/20714/Bobra.0058s0043.1